MDSGVLKMLLKRAGVPDDVDLGTREVLGAAMRAAAEITHECGTPEATDAAIVEVFRDALMGAAILRNVQAGPPVYLGYTSPSIRDTFAAAALTGMCANPMALNKVNMDGCNERLARDAYWLADAMLKARERK